jgi:MFS family permease
MAVSGEIPVPSPEGVAALASGRDTIVLSILLLGGIIYTVCQALMLPTLGVIARATGSSASSATWVLTIYILSGGVATPILGRLGDMFGKQRALVVMLATVTAGVLLSALSDSLALVLVGRALAGTSSGIFPLGFGIIRDEFPRERVVTAVGIMSVSVGVGTALGVLVAGPIVSGLGVHWLFWLPFVVAAPTCLAAWRLIPESPRRPGGSVDWAGAGLLVAGLVAVLLAISEATEWGWGSVRTVVLGVGGLVVLAGWTRFERTLSEPLIDMHTMSLPTVWRTNAAAAFSGFAMFSAFALIPRFTQEPVSSGYGFGASISAAGLYLVPATVTMVMVAPLAGYLERRVGTKLALIVGCVCAGLGFVVIALLPKTPSHIYVGTALIGVGLGLAYAALPNLVMTTVPRAQTGAATGINTIVRAIGGAVGVSVCTTFIAQSEHGHGSPTLGSYTLAFWLCAGALCGATVVSLLLPAQAAGSAAAALGEGEGEG